jgi:hypothetical protein
MGYREISARARRSKSTRSVVIIQLGPAQSDVDGNNLSG